MGLLPVLNERVRVPVERRQGDVRDHAMAKSKPRERLRIQRLDEIQRRFKKVLVEGEKDEAAHWLDLRLSVDDPLSTRKPDPPR